MPDGDMRRRDAFSHRRLIVERIVQAMRVAAFKADPEM